MRMGIFHFSPIQISNENGHHSYVKIKMMTILQSIILGIVEGITEFLPISSTGHLILAAKVLNIFESDFVKSFEIIIQLGAILAVVWLYRKKIWPFDLELWKRVIVSFIPTAIIGFILYKIIKGFLLGNVWVTAVALIVGGIVIILFEQYVSRASETFEAEHINTQMRTMSYKKAFFIGIFQSIAVIPGVSRSAATIIGGQSLSLSRQAIVEYSFILAIPTMLAASGYDLLKSGINFSGDQFTTLLIGFVVSFIVAIFAIKFLLRFIKTHNFIWFGIYRIIVGIIFLFFI